MFFKKRREAKKAAAAQQECDNISKEYETQLHSAEACPDPAERFLKLEELQKAITARIDLEKKEIDAQALKSFRKTDATVSMSTMAGIGGLIVGLHAPPLMLLMFPAMIGSTKAGQAAMGRKKAELENLRAPLFKALNGLKAKALDEADAILKTDLAAIATSPKYEEILAKAPRIRDHFTKAFVRRINNQDDPDHKIERPGPKKPDNGFSL
jgi:hypothetical protein